MAELLQLQFNAPGAEGLYQQVNDLLGFNPNSTENHPAGLLSHIAGVGADAQTLVVTEIWESQAAQEAFLAERLAPALKEAGVPDPTVLAWYTLLGNAS